jgi:hypothetical protein
MDPELRAIGACIRVVSKLPLEAQGRVGAYLFSRFSFKPAAPAAQDSAELF